MGNTLWQRMKTSIEWFSSSASAVSSMMIIVMMFITVSDVILRKFSSGINGAVELNGLVLVVITFFALADCWNKEGHIQVDLLLQRAAPKWRSLSKVFNSLVGFCLFGIILYGGVKFSYLAYKKSEVSAIILVPLFPVKLVMVLGCFIFCAQLIVSFITSLRSFAKGGGG